MENERQEKEERERQEMEAALQLLELKNRAERERITEQMKAFGIAGAFTVTPSGYISGNGYLEMSQEDLYDASMLEERLNRNKVLNEHVQERLRHVKVRDKWFAVVRSAKSGRITVLGLRDPRAVDSSTQEAKNETLEVQDIAG